MALDIFSAILGIVSLITLYSATFLKWKGEWASGRMHVRITGWLMVLMDIIAIILNSSKSILFSILSLLFIAILLFAGFYLSRLSSFSS